MGKKGRAVGDPGRPLTIAALPLDRSAVLMVRVLLCSARCVGPWLASKGAVAATAALRVRAHAVGHAGSGAVQVDLAVTRIASGLLAFLDRLPFIAVVSRRSARARVSAGLSAPAADHGHVIPITTDRLTTLSPCLSRLSGVEFVRRPFGVRRSSSFARDLALLLRVH